MKRSVLVLLVMIILSASCTKKEDYGQLEVTVLDALDNPIMGKYVYLFESEEDRAKHMAGESGYSSDKEITDNYGVAFFRQAKIGDYWLYCQYENITGGNTDVTGTATVLSEQSTEITIKP